MLAISGTVVIARHEAGTDGQGTHRTCNVLAIEDDGDFLVAPLNDEPRLASEIGIIEQFIPTPSYIPAAPGWWARFKIEDDEEGEHQSYLLPVVGWRVGSEESPVVLDNMYRVAEGPPHVVGNPQVVDNPERECRGDLDAVIYDPSLSGAPASSAD